MRQFSAVNGQHCKKEGNYSPLPFLWKGIKALIKLNKKRFGDMKRVHEQGGVGCRWERTDKGVILVGKKCWRPPGKSACEAGWFLDLQQILMTT